MVNTRTLFEPLFATKRNRPDGSTESATGFVPTATGAVVAFSSPIVWLIVKIATLPDARYGPYVRRLQGSTAMANGPVPSDVRVPTGVSPPPVMPIEKIEMLFDP